MYNYVIDFYVWGKSVVGPILKHLNSYHAIFFLKSPNLSIERKEFWARLDNSSDLFG